jgi:hypothetical protein
MEWIYACLAALAAVQEPADPALKSVPSHFRLTAPIVDSDPESGLWARGANWKLNVSDRGATFYPMTREMTRHVPLELAAPEVRIGGRPISTDEPRTLSRSADALAADRGGFVERWNLSLDSVEQTFEFATLPSRGELVIDLPITSEWVYRGRDNGLLFHAPGLGDVRYGDVMTRDAAGRSVATASEFLGDRIRLRVPESFVVSARLPLVVDPVVEFLVLESSAALSVHDPKTSYDAASDRYLMVFATNLEYISGDSDLIGYLLDGDGALISTLALDLTTNRTYVPDVCNLWSTAYFVVAYTNISLVAVNSIRVRFVTTSGSIGPAFSVKSGDYCNNPRVAGSMHSGISMALVVYTEGNFFNRVNKLRHVATSNLGVIGTTHTLASGGVFNAHDVTASDGPEKRWAVVWTDATNSSSVIVNGRLIDVGTGVPVGNQLFFGSNGAAIQDVAIAGDGQTFVAMWTRLVSGTTQHEIFARKLKFLSGSLATDGPMVNFTALDAQSGVAIQMFPSLARDGGRYVFTANVSPAVATLGTFVTTAAGFQLLEQDQSVPSNGLNNYSRDITTKFQSGGPVGEAFACWSFLVPNINSNDLGAAIYQPALASGGVEVSQTGCGGVGVEPQISFAGQLSIAGGTGTINLTSQPFGSPQIWVGTPLVYQLCTACPFGVVASNIVPGNSLTIVNGTSPALLGTQIAIQGVVMNPLLGTKCTNLAGQTFQTSDTLIITLQ